MTSIINRLTRGLIYKEGELSLARTGTWFKRGKYWISYKILTFLTLLRILPIYLLSQLKVKWAIRSVGRALGYGACLRCKMPWNHVKPKTIMYRPDSGMFPLCVDCFDSLSIEEIDLYIERLVSEWPECDSERQEIAELAKAEAGRMKER